MGVQGGRAEVSTTQEAVAGESTGQGRNVQQRKRHVIGDGGAAPRGDCHTEKSPVAA